MSDARTGFHVNSVTVVVAYETKNGIEEVIHQVDGKHVDILSVHHGVDRKAIAKKDPNTGDIMSYEATGEEILTLKVKYIKG
jgi:hypothetical protein